MEMEGANPKLFFGRVDHFHDEVVEGAVDLFEPVRNAGRDDDDVAFFEELGFAVGDFFATDLAWAFGAGIGNGAASDEGGGAFEDVKDIGFRGVLFRFARGVAAAGMDFIFGSLEERNAFNKAGGDLIGRDESDFGEGFLVLGGAGEDKDQAGKTKE